MSDIRKYVTEFVKGVTAAAPVSSVSFVAQGGGTKTLLVNAHDAASLSMRELRVSFDPDTKIIRNVSLFYGRTISGLHKKGKR